MYELIQLYTELKQKNQDLSNIESKINELENKLSIVDKGLKLTKLAKSYKIESRKEFILDLINTSLKIVFGENYRVDLVVDESKTSSKYNITYKIVLYKDDKIVATNQDLFVTTGGGVITVISFIIKIALGYINTKNKFYILDEVFSQVSEKYKPGLAKLLRLLVDKYGFTFFIISHDKLEEEDVDLVYEATNQLKDGIPTLILKNTYQSYRYRENKDLAYKVEIENFQAIGKLKLNIYGITVVYGNSDSGKSAIQRAISSVILNDFKPKVYPRWRKGRTKLTTKVKIEKEGKFIQLEYKDIVKYKLHTDEEFTGKKLASENIEKALSDLGFIKIDISNLTGELKNQISRIYVTTQFDKLFLPDDRNGVEKILTILFNSQIYNYMIQEINKDFNSIKSEISKLYDYKQELEHTIKPMRIKFYEKLHESVRKYKDQLDLIDKLNHQLNSTINNKKTISNILLLLDTKKKITKLKEVKDKIVNLSQSQLELQELIENIKILINVLKHKLIKSNLIDLQNVFNKVSNKSNLVSDIILLYSIKNNIYKLNKINESIQVNEDYLNKIRNLQELYHKIILLHKLKEKENIISSLENLLRNNSNEIKELKESFNICKCPKCNGEGYIICGAS